MFCADQKVFLGKCIEKIPISMWRKVVVKYDKWGQYNTKQKKASIYYLNEIRYRDITDAPAYITVLGLLGILLIIFIWNNVSFWK
jgi:hypothetical protein